MRKQLNIPNSMSICRLALIPVVFYLIVNTNSQNYPWLIGVFCFSILLDFLDGLAARLLSQETELGKILDPLADKLLIIIVIVALIVKSDFPIWLAVFIFARDMLIALAAFILLRKKRTVIPSNLIGKITFSATAFLIFIYILDLHINLDLTMHKRFFTVAATAFLVWSWFEYYFLYKEEKNAT